MAYRENQIELLRQETGFDEITVGCFLSNYGTRHVCPIATGGWCRDYVKCKCMEEGISRKIQMQQDHNEEMTRKDKENRMRGVVLAIVLGFLIIMDLVMIVLIIWLIIGR